MGNVAAEWFAMLDALDVPCEICSESFSLELFDDVEMIEKGLVARHPHALFGTIEMAGRSIDFSGTPASIGRGPCVTGQHTSEILREMGYDQTQIDALFAGESRANWRRMSPSRFPLRREPLGL